MPGSRAQESKSASLSPSFRFFAAVYKWTAESPLNGRDDAWHCFCDRFFTFPCDSTLFCPSYQHNSGGKKCVCVCVFSYEILYCNLCFSARIWTGQGKKTVEGCGGQSFACEKPVCTALTETNDSWAHELFFNKYSHWNISQNTWRVIYCASVALDMVLIRILKLSVILLWNLKFIIYELVFPPLTIA